MEKVSKEQHTEAVARFVALARQPTSGGRVAAQVLLSTYNGNDFQLDLADMGSLDRSNFETAMTILRGRYETGHEPHSLIVNGSSVFGELWDSWFALHVTERGKVDCTDCDDNRTKPCPRCAGHRRICRCGR